MSSQRTGGMIALGIVNIILGLLGTGINLLGVLAMGAITALAASDTSGDPVVEGVAASGLFMTLGLLGAAVLWICTIIGGIGIISVKSWGRFLCLACGGIMALTGVLSILSGDGFIGPGLMFITGAVQIGLLNRPDWKRAFASAADTQTGSPDGIVLDDAGNTDNNDDRFRHAA